MVRTNLEGEGHSRRWVLKRGAVISAALGLGLPTISGRAIAMNKAELIDSIASEADITKADTKKALEAFIDTTTKALAKGNRVSLIGFGSFSVSERAQKSERNISKNGSMISFDPSPDLGAALDLIPGEGDRRRVEAMEKNHDKKKRRRRSGRDDEVIIDAERLLAEIEREEETAEKKVDKKKRRTADRLTRKEAKKALDAFIDTTTKALKKGDRVSLAGFGSFSVSKRSARKGRNPQTGKEIKIPAKKVVKFKPGAELSERVK